MHSLYAAPRFAVGCLLLLLLFQPVQWYAIASYGEPYPTLTFPVFQGPGQQRSAGRVSWKPTFTAHWESGQSTDVPMNELFADVPLPTRWSVITRNFGPSRLEESDQRTSVPASWLPGRQQLLRRSSNPALAREATAWLSSRLGTMYKGQRAVAMTVRWSEVRDTGTALVKATRIEFDEPYDGR